MFKVTRVSIVQKTVSQDFQQPSNLVFCNLSRARVLQIRENTLVNIVVEARSNIWFSGV